MMDWKPFDGGNTIGTLGSERGIIFKDEELNDCARVSLEKDCEHAPYCITLGIYYLALHTNYYSNLEAALNDFSWYKFKIEEILNFGEFKNEERDGKWYEKRNKMLDELTSR